MQSRESRLQGLPLQPVSGSKITSRSHRQFAIGAEQAAETSVALDLATDNLHTIAAGCWRS